MTYVIETFIIQRLQNMELHLPVRSMDLSHLHPLLLFLLMFAGIPVLMVLAVALCACLIILPVSWLLGWP